MLNYLHRVVDGISLTSSEAEWAMEQILDGAGTTAQIASLLVALRMKGETPDEMLGFARAMRGKANKVAVADVGEPLLDTCGTGGDTMGTFSVSTLVAFVVAGAGVRVAKHGNRAVSSRFGSADLMEALGVRLTVTPTEIAAAIRDIGIGFLYAPAIHPAMKHAQQARSELKLRTAFNLLGPLTNPAGARHQLSGVWSERAGDLVAETLARLGVDRAFIVHGADGMDEITTTTTTTIWDVTDTVDRFQVSPEHFGVPVARIEQLRMDPVEAAHQILGGQKGPPRDIVLVNASAALVAAGKAAYWKEGVAMAAESIDSGAAKAKLEALRDV